MTKEERIIEDKLDSWQADNKATDKETDAFESGVIWALSHPELMREEIGKVIGWMVENKNTERLDEADVPNLVNEYLEHLKQNA